MTKRVLLTGGTGFIGRHAVEVLLARGYEVHVVARRSEPPIRANVLWHQADLLDPTASQALIDAIEPSHLLHLAWYATPGAFWTSEANVHWLEASLRLLRAFADGGGHRAVVAGTSAEYDWSVGGVLREAVTPVAPRTLYGQCKAALYAVTEPLYAAPDGPTLGWGRVFFLYGPHEHPDRLVSSVTRALLKGHSAPTSHGRQIRDFLHSADVASAFVALLDSEVAGPVNIGSGTPVTIAEVVGLVAEATGRRELLQLGAIPARADEPAQLVADVGRLRDEVGFVPRFTLEEGIRSTVEWWRQTLVSP
jgi:nucleoside-diphosphate-sugar epimerase